MLNRKRGRKSVFETGEEFNKRKRCIISVKSRQFSFLNAIIIALSFPDNRCKFVLQNKLNLNSKQRLNQGKYRFKILRKQLNTLATDYLTFKPTQIKHWQKFFGSVNFNLVVISTQSHFKRLSRKALFSKDKKIRNLFLGRFKNNELKYEFSAIKKPAGYFNKFVCKKCFKSSKSKKEHSCQYECFMCKSSTRHDKLLKSKNSYCRSCNRNFYSKLCKDIHIQNGVCDRKKICKKCDNLYVVVKNKEHRCYPKDYCRRCKLTHPPNRHYIKSISENVKPVQNFLIFDFETFHAENMIEIPYLCVSRLYSMEYSKKTEVNPNHELVGHSHIEKVFYGLNCCKDFYDYLISTEVPSKTVCIAHNGQAFDFYFVLQQCYQRGKLKPDLILNGTKLMQMTIVGNDHTDLKFIDSLNFIPFPLGRFHEIFGFDEQKGIFPYNFVQANNLDYRGPIPEESFFEVKDSNRQQYEEELEKFKTTGFWDLRQIATDYCVQDVNVLFQGIWHYLQTFQKISGNDPFA